MNLVQTQVQIGKVETLKDKSLKLTIYTQELDASSKTRLFEFSEKLPWMVLADKEQDQVTVPDLPAQDFKNEKSPSKRLRAVLFVFWKEVMNGVGDFELFYRREMERIIDSYKQELD